MTSVRKETRRQFLLEKVLPAIKAKWPAEEKGMPIFIQQDNAKTHIDVNNPAFLETAQVDGWDIWLTCQPPNSPDLYVLDLGFFAGVQALFHKGVPNNVEEIMSTVEKAYQDYLVDIPHIRKKSLEMRGELPVTLECDRDLYNQA
jgi:hypothetical protein